MTDRELLELAAKAGGYRYDEFQMCWYEDSEMREPAWNPLTDDGDALRLAVKLNLIVNCIHVEILVEEPVCRNIEVWEKLGIDSYAATRRAIVRAAAEIGKEML